ncbi:MAG: ImmA/IrrE family metallo-endopeptidase [Firmicutes bacterium]|nr:ImmA/IrrE family metallo-endopeptidase [Bacillota bacterium]
MDTYKRLIYNRIKRLRQQYNLGNYCGRSIFDVIEKIEIDGENPLLFRLPFMNNRLSGFVGYKKGRFSVFLNSSRTLGYEVFTAAHEIFHLIENTSVIRENTVVEEYETLEKEAMETAADLFAAELLMPEGDITREYERLMKTNGLKKPDETLIINLQQQYFVEYKAVTKRLKEIGIIDEKEETALDRILDKKNELAKLTQKIGYTNQLNEPSKAVHLPRKFLKAIEENFKNGNTTFDDLIVLFGYCNLSPQDFGYEEDELSDGAKALMERIRSQLGSESVGQK